VVVAATRAGLAELLHLAGTAAGDARTIADLPPPPGRSRTRQDAAVAVLRDGATKVIRALPHRSATGRVPGTSAHPSIAGQARPTGSSRAGGVPPTDRIVR